MRIEELPFELSIILFSVSLIFTVSMMIDKYPKIHRFGHGLKKESGNYLNLKVMFYSWLILIVLMLSTFLSFYYFFLLVNCSSADHICYLAYLFPIIYFLIPSLIERTTTGAVILGVKEDFKNYMDKPEKEEYVKKRFSPETIKSILDSLQNPKRGYPLYMVVDSLSKYVFFILAPILYYYYNYWWLVLLAISIYFLGGLLTGLIQNPEETKDVK